MRDAFAHDEHGFGHENPYSEPAFQRLAPQTRAAPAPPGRLAYDPHTPVQTPVPLPLPNTTARRRAAILAERLSHPDAARDAIVLHAIFQRPGARPPGRPR